MLLWEENSIWYVKICSQNNLIALPIDDSEISRITVSQEE